jgi:hypothetical protein
MRVRERIAGGSGPAGYRGFQKYVWVQPNTSTRLERLVCPAYASDIETSFGRKSLSVTL